MTVHPSGFTADGERAPLLADVSLAQSVSAGLRRNDVAVRIDDPATGRRRGKHRLASTEATAGQGLAAWHAEVERRSGEYELARVEYRRIAGGAA